MTQRFQGLRTAMYFVTDVTKAKEWYIGVTGKHPYYDTPYYVGFNIGGYELGLHPAEHVDAAGAASLRVYWGVDDARVAYQELLAAGATPLEEPQDVGGEIVVAAVKDPWGNALGVIYNPHFGV